MANGKARSLNGMMRAPAQVGPEVDKEGIYAVEGGS